jgi:hypothetical protein
MHSSISRLAWALIRPFLTMFVFSVCFGKVSKLPTEIWRFTPPWSSPHAGLNLFCHRSVVNFGWSDQ